MIERRNIMNKKEMKKIENQIIEIMNDLSLEIIRNEENQKILISDSKRNEINSYLENELSEDELNLFFEKKIQIHNKIDRDIKIDMKKIDDYNIKLIYHRKKDDSKEYRLFISYKDENNHLKRKRMINDSIRKIHNNEDKMIDYFNKIKISDIQKSLSI